MPNILHAGDPLPKSIFLAGPTPREEPGREPIPSWRPEAIEILGRLGFEGAILVPERLDWSALKNPDDQIHWEWEGLNLCTVAFFWIPREIDRSRHDLGMPALTTNVEFGLMAAGSKAVLARPPGAPRMGYLDSLARRYAIPIENGLESGLAAAVAKAKAPFAPR